MIVTIDGPVAAGKTSCARRLATDTGFALLDTGAIYRTVALAALRDAVDWQDELGLADLAARLSIDFSFDGDVNRVRLGGEDVTGAIRSPEISNGASIVSAHPCVRRSLLALQRRYAEQADVVAEGRDTGTVIFPDADCKFFLDARPEVRARRRLDELLRRGIVTELDSVVRDMRERDHRDAERTVAPLVQADDALYIDSSERTLDEVVAQMLAALVESQPGGSV